MDAFAFLRRRTFLKLGVAGLAGLGVAGGGLVALRGSALAVGGLGVLDAHRFRTLLAIAEAQLPVEGAGAGAVCDRLARLFDGFLQGEHEENVGDLKTALLLVEYGPVIFERRLTTFSNLVPDQRRRHWRGWMESELAVRRQVSLAFRKFFHAVFFDDPAVWPQIGYPGPSLWGMPKEGATP
ncbi:MAG: hypothetical protein HYS27_05045 [Deltaproteobacteria bacterium]|nr:hypothetical protein [Deltaproteobacteria bacterium]